MADYTRQIQTALNMIAKYGQVCEWRKDNVVLTDPERPWLGGDKSTVVYNPPILFLPASNANSGFELLQFTPGQNAEFSTVGLMGVHEFEPNVADTVLRGGTPLVIKKVDTLRPAEQAVLYILSIV